MRGGSYVAKRAFFAVMTLFLAVTLNFIIFRALPGDAVTGLRCQACSPHFKAHLRAQPGSITQSSSSTSST